MKTELEERGRASLLLGLTTLILMLFVSLANAQTTKVLFLGNSFTYTYDIPTLFDGLATDAGENVLVDEYTQAGIAVYDDQVYGHINDAAAQAKITSQQWDYVVIQDNMGGWVYNVILGTPGNANVTLYDQIKANNPCTRIIYFSAWGPEGGVPQLGYAGESTTSCNTRIYNNWISFNDQVADEIVSPIGLSWNESLSALPSVDLFYSDNVHPSLAGSYLAAATLFTSVFKTDPSVLSYNGGVSSSTANTMKSIAWNTVMDPTTMTECNLDEHMPATVSNSNDLLSVSGGTTYQWYLNGNAISGATSSTYTATQTGTYTVVSFDSDGCGSLSEELEVTSVSGGGSGSSGIEDETILFSMFPNPATNKVIIQSSTELNEITISDISGKIVYSNQAINSDKTEIFIEDFEAGIYIVNLISSQEKVMSQRLIVQ